MDSTSLSTDSTDTGHIDKVLIEVKTAHPNETYTVKLYVTDTWETLGTITTGTSTNLGEIADHLRDDITSQTIDSNINATSDGNVIIIATDDATSLRDKSFKVEDSMGNTLMTIINGQAIKASDLPKFAPDAYKVNVTGVDEQNHLANYWLQFDGKTGVWRETVGASIYTKIDKNTMPVFVIKTGANTFVVCEAGHSNLGTQQSASEWGDRLVGDLDSNPTPSFIGKSIVL